LLFIPSQTHPKLKGFYKAFWLLNVKFSFQNYGPNQNYSWVWIKFHNHSACFQNLMLKDSIWFYG
jgi:hypothetical protein